MNAFQRSLPSMVQILPRLQESVSFGEHEQSTTWHQVWPALPGQIPKHSFGPISSNCISESLPDDDPHSGRSIIHLAHKKVEERG